MHTNRTRALMTVVAPLLAGCASPSPPDDPGTGPPGPSAEIALDLREETYPVVGSSFEEVGRSLRAMSPRLGGRSARGVHNARVGWSFSYGMVDGRCRIENLEVVVTSTILLPRWERPAGVSRELERAWEAYLAGIRAHEERHRELALEAAAEVRRGMGGLEAAACSEAFADRVDGVGHEILAAYEERNRAFDRTAPRVEWPPGEVELRRGLGRRGSRPVSSRPPAPAAPPEWGRRPGRRWRDG